MRSWKCRCIQCQCPFVVVLYCIMLFWWYSFCCCCYIVDSSSGSIDGENEEWEKYLCKYVVSLYIWLTDRLTDRRIGQKETRPYEAENVIDKQKEKIVLLVVGVLIIVIIIITSRTAVVARAVLLFVFVCLPSVAVLVKNRRLLSIHSFVFLRFVFECMNVCMVYGLLCCWRCFSCFNYF